MRALLLLALALAAAGLVLLAYGLPREGGQVFFVLVFPVFVLQGPVSAAGAALLFFGSILGFLSLLWRIPERLLGWGPSWPAERMPVAAREAGRPEAAEAPRTEKRFGGILLLGPIPIVFGSDARVTAGMLILALVLTVLLLVLFL